ncbi:MAG: citrate synthase [Oscillospiraceae bacterium]|jgi:citrate synthase|nr:citrate synthase [Oscillospiraceae bacterium]
MAKAGEKNKTGEFISEVSGSVLGAISFDKSLYDEYGVKRGLRNADGTGVMAGITGIGNVRGYFIRDGERVPAPGELTYRGIDINELCDGFLKDGRLGYEETAYLLLFGKLPSKAELQTFCERIAELRVLPEGFTEDMILAAPSLNIMNKLSRSFLALYSYDDAPETYGGDVKDELEKALCLTARAPIIIANAFAAKRHYYDKGSLHIRRPEPSLSTAENLLRIVRRTGKFTDDEARLLDLCLVIHAEHGGGNNSTFACRVLSSSGTDIYSALSAAVGSLKGALHGGANERVLAMFDDIEANVENPNDDGEVRDYLLKIVRGEAGLRDGKIYGMGHAVYTLSDPRALILKNTARKLAEKSEFIGKFNLIETVERLTPGVLAETGKRTKPICANVDMYSGMVYKMLGIPRELYTPLFAVARVPGWCAHRIEELWSNGRIIRPAYKAIAKEQRYVPIDERQESEQ